MGGHGAGHYSVAWYGGQLGERPRPAREAARHARSNQFPGTARVPVIEVDERRAGMTRFQPKCGDCGGKVSKAWSTPGRRAAPGISQTSSKHHPVLHSAPPILTRATHGST